MKLTCRLLFSHILQCFLPCFLALQSTHFLPHVASLLQLYSSGIYCKESPTFHDLFGFSVEDVLEEVKRGSKLVKSHLFSFWSVICYRLFILLKRNSTFVLQTCDKCKKKGATVGCEIRRCQKSYHFPCALKEGAEILQDEDRGTFGSV